MKAFPSKTGKNSSTFILGGKSNMTIKEIFELSYKKYPEEYVWDATLIDYVDTNEEARNNYTLKMFGLK